MLRYGNMGVCYETYDACIRFGDRISAGFIAGQLNSTRRRVELRRESVHSATPTQLDVAGTHEV